jgi:hypothetical protein
MKQQILLLGVLLENDRSTRLLRRHPIHILHDFEVKEGWVGLSSLPHRRRLKQMLKTLSGRR